MSDDTDSNVISLPTRGSDSGGMPDAPDGGDLFYSEPPDSGSGGSASPEPAAEAARKLPPIRGPISPENALRETGMTDAPDSGDGEYVEGEYVQSRSLADRLGDWLEYRLEVARERHAGEAPFREAEIARKAALIEARTAQETAMMEQNSKLHTAQMKAKADKAAAHGKADAARSSSSGMGADKGGRSKAGGGSGSRSGGGSSGGTGRGTGGGRGPGTNGSGGTGRGSGGGNSPKGTGKGSDRPAGGRGGPSKVNESSGGSKGRQNRSEGSGKSGTGKGSSGGSGGRNGSGGSGGGRGGSKDDAGRTHNSPASSPRAERARGRQDRAAARQAARHQRRSADQAANLADRSKDRDQDRANTQAAREERRRAKAERQAARKAKREAADGRTTLGAAIAEEAQRRWDKRRAAKDKAAKDDTADGTAKEPTSDKDSEATTKSKDGPEPAADGATDDSAAKEPDDGEKAGEKPSDGSGDTDRKDDAGTDDGPKPDDTDPPGTDESDGGRSFKEKLKDFFTKGEDTTPPEPEEPSPLRPEDLGDVTVDRPDGPPPSPTPEPAEQDIPDAVIVDDPADPFGATITTAASLPRAPEPHTQRPGTTRPTAQEDPVASEVSTPTSGQAGMAAKHRTDITFGEYLMEIVNIAIAAALDKDRAQELAVALGKVADALRDMATDLVGDHNIATEVVDQVTDLADAATRMKQLAERCATECEIASEAARIAATSVGRIYGEDIAAMDDAGLAHASSAAHHD
ncbi:ATP/GTP-binding protein [Streptomyces sp. NPDC092307]|uniref:ATP/GTP-binding protein n=1 Tax=Streptomyces sp. NPDC092307 TaxID=3366013 RepID=UPI003805B876